jgi:hypothetical protein
MEVVLEAWNLGDCSPEREDCSDMLGSFAQTSSFQMLCKVCHNLLTGSPHPGLFFKHCPANLDVLPHAMLNYVIVSSLGLDAIWAAEHLGETRHLLHLLALKQVVGVDDDDWIRRLAPSAQGSLP